MPSLSDLTLALCAFWMVAGPLLSERIEERVEWLSLGLGAVALTVSWSWSERIVVESLSRASALGGALVGGALLFSMTHVHLRRAVRFLCSRLGARPAVAATVAVSGLATPFVTGGVAVLLLVEALSALPLEDSRRREVAVLGCCAIGLGSGLSSVGGPAAAVLMSKVSGTACTTSGAFLLALVGPWVIPGILGLAGGASVLCGESDPRSEPAPQDPLSLWSLLVLTGRMFVLTAGLVLLGAGLIPLIERVSFVLRPATLFWANGAASFMDNSALVTVQIAPAMSMDQLRYAILGVLTSGGALLAGDPPNLVVAHKLGIPARSWAVIGVPVSISLMLFCYLTLMGG